MLTYIYLHIYIYINIHYIYIAIYIYIYMHCGRCACITLPPADEDEFRRRIDEDEFCRRVPEDESPRRRIPKTNSSPTVSSEDSSFLWTIFLWTSATSKRPFCQCSSPYDARFYYYCFPVGSVWKAYTITTQIWLHLRRLKVYYMDISWNIDSNIHVIWSTALGWGTWILFFGSGAYVKSIWGGG